MQDNAIIIKLQDGDITTAQDDPDIEGIIHIPSIEYDHCVQEVQVPGQSFFNGLYIDVQDLEIGGSGLPIVIDRVKTTNSGADFINTRNFTLLTQGVQLSLRNQAVLSITYNPNANTYGINYYLAYGKNIEVILPLINNQPTRYYVFDVSSNTTRMLLYSGDDFFFRLEDFNYSDNQSSNVLFSKNFVDFDWGNN